MTLSITWPFNFSPPYDYASCLLGASLIRGCQHWSLSLHLVICTVILQIPATYLPDYDLVKTLVDDVREQRRKETP